MTKKELLQDERIFGAANGDVSYIPLHSLEKFLSSNVCIPKGANRHPDADVLHALAEDISLPAEYICNGNWEEYAVQLDRFRIKPSEPVYEWQWMYKFKNGNEFQFTGYETETEVRHFMSQLDKDSIGHYATKIEETKRERKQ